MTWKNIYRGSWQWTSGAGYTDVLTSSSEANAIIGDLQL